MGQETQQNLELFDKLDFEGWNGPNWDTFSRLHTDDVVVEFLGQRTEGRQAHVDFCRDIIEQNPDMKIASHPIKVAQGEWTAVVGEMSDGSRMVTVAKWRDGAVAEEYIWMGQQEQG